MSGHIYRISCVPISGLLYIMPYFGLTDKYVSAPHTEILICDATFSCLAIYKTTS